jgi:hypothetical protein
MSGECSIRNSYFKIFRQSGAILLIAAMIGLAANYLRGDRLPLVAPLSVQPATTFETGGPDLAVSLDQAESLYFAHEAVFIDARSETDLLAGFPG